MRTFEAVAGQPTIVCEQPLDFEFCEATGLFYISDPALSVRRAIAPAVMQETIARAAACYRGFRTRQSAEIIRMPERNATAA